MTALPAGEARASSLAEAVMSGDIPVHLDDAVGGVEEGAGAACHDDSGDAVDTIELPDAVEEGG